MELYRDRIPGALLPVPARWVALSFHRRLLWDQRCVTRVLASGRGGIPPADDQMWAINRAGNSAVAHYGGNRPTVAVLTPSAIAPRTCRMWYYMYDGGGFLYESIRGRGNL